MTNCQDYDFDSVPPWRPKDKYRSTTGDAVVERVGGSDEFPLCSYGFRWNLSEMAELARAAQKPVEEVINEQANQLIEKIQEKMFMDVCGSELKEPTKKFEVRRVDESGTEGFTISLDSVPEGVEMESIVDMIDRCAFEVANKVGKEVDKVVARTWNDNSVKDETDEQLDKIYPRNHSLESILALHKDLCKEACDLVAKKGADYNREEQKNGDTLANLKAAYKLGLVENPAQGILIRLLDKIMRLKSLCKPGEKPANKEEKIKDTVIDMINYSLYVYALSEWVSEEEAPNAVARK